MKAERVLKYIDALTTGPQNMTATGTIGALVNIPQGNAQSQRIGDLVEIAKINLIALSVTAANSDVYSHARVILFRWKPSIGSATPNVGEILQTPSVNSVYSALNYEERSTYSIQWDRHFSLTGTSTVPTDKSDHFLVNQTIPVHGKSIVYDLGSASNSTGTMCILYLSDSAASPFPVLMFNFRIWYYDA